MEEIKTNRLNRWISKLETSALLRIVQQCFSYLIPILVIGSFSLVLYTIPIPGYLTFINTFAGGFFLRLFTVVNTVTLGCMSLFVVTALPIAYCSVTATSHTAYPVFVSLACYLAYVGDIKTVASLEAFSSKWTFIALIIASLVCLFIHVAVRTNTRLNPHNSGVGFYISPHYLLLAALIILLFAAIGRLLSGTQNLNFLSTAFERLFRNLGCNFGSALLFTLLVHLLWMFGIHGGNVLDGVSTQVFEKSVQINQSLLLAGQAPTEVFSKSFFDVFVLMGGCGASLCIVAALLLAARRRNNRMVARSALLPCLFNISEMVVYGLPVILNPVMLIPFLLTPMIMLSTSALATAVGLIPPVCQSVTWTTPILLSGYAATGTVMGSLVQLFNLAVGTLIYLPFIRLSERISAACYRADIDRATEELLRDETAGRECHPLTRRSPYQPSVQNLLYEFYQDYAEGRVTLFYQPQVDSSGRTIGAEALLRWENQDLGFLAPPLVIALARDDQFGEKLGYSIIEWAAADLERMSQSGLHHYKLSVNIAAFQLADPDFCRTLRAILAQHDFGDCCLSLEITEREAMYITSYISEVIEELKSMGITMILDDFGMGHNSITYISQEQFEFVKLDGALVRDILKNPRSQDIVRSICALGRELGCQIVAEYVESMELRNMLETLGCRIYQGYYYGRAVPLEEFLKRPVLTS